MQEKKSNEKSSAIYEQQTAQHMSNRYYKNGR